MIFLKKLQIIIISLLLLFFLNLNSFAQTISPTPTPTIDSAQQQDLQNKINDLQNKINDLQGQERTFSSQIAVMDNQIQLAEYQIASTEEQITNISLDIDTATKKVSGLEKSLNSLVDVLLNRMVATYEVGTIQPLQILLTSNDASDFLSRLNYLKRAQAHDKQLVYETQQAKIDYANQKAIFEEKKKKIEALKAQLEDYNKQLDSEKQAKKALLAQTQGSEANYQSLLAQARAQLAAFSGFVRTQGGLSVINADPSWPSDYFSQRDSRWANVAIAGYYSSGEKVYSIGEAGCLISSVAMTLTHRGNATTPLVIGTNGSYFFDSNFQWSGLTSLGFNTPKRTTDRSTIDSYLSQGKWVIVGISYSNSASSNPFHFVVITSKNGDDYNLYDPWNGPNVSYNNYYSSNYITEVITY